MVFWPFILVYYNWQQSKDQLLHPSHSKARLQRLQERGAFKFAAAVRKSYLRSAFLTHFFLTKSAAKGIDCIFDYKDIFRHCSDFYQKAQDCAFKMPPKQA